MGTKKKTEAPALGAFLEAIDIHAGGRGKVTPEAPIVLVEAPERIGNLRNIKPVNGKRKAK